MPRIIHLSSTDGLLVVDRFLTLSLYYNIWDQNSRLACSHACLEKMKKKKKKERRKKKKVMLSGLHHVRGLLALIQPDDAQVDPKFLVARG